MTPTETAKVSANVRVMEVLDLLPQAIASIVRDGYDSGDPYGSIVANAFALNEVTLSIGGIPSADYTHGASEISSVAEIAESEEYPDCEYAIAYLEDSITVTDLQRSIVLFDALLKVLDDLGLGY